LQNKQFVILMKISSKMAFENFKNFISFHETFKTKFSTHISIPMAPVSMDVIVSSRWCGSNVAQFVNDSGSS